MTEKWEDTSLFIASRDMRGWSQAQLAEKLEESAQFVSDLENNRRPVSRKLAARLGEAWAALNFMYGFQNSRQCLEN